MTPEETRAYYGRIAEGMRRAQAPQCTDPGAEGAELTLHRPGCPHRADERYVNVATYARPSTRHHWRLIGTRVNVPELIASPLPVMRSRDVQGAEFATVPYDPDVWQPPRSTPNLPGLPVWPGEPSPRGRVPGWLPVRP